jgi:hypothetical protein
MVSIKRNVTTFNEFVRLQTYALKANEENLSDVMVNLFKVYLATLDIEFQQFIKQKKNGRT